MSGVIDTMRRAPHSRRAQRSQSGFTLLEAIVSLALVSGVVLTLAAGMLTTVKSSNSAKGTQIVDVALSAYTEGFKGVYPARTPGATSCPDPSEFEAMSTEPAWFTADVSNLTSWNVTLAEGWDDPAGSWVDCTAGGPASGVTRLTVEVAADTPAGPQTATGQVVVREDTT
jgi:type II secretory pathway pseudopilin PulG